MIYGFKNRRFSNCKTCPYGWKCCNSYGMSPRFLKKMDRRIERRRLDKFYKECYNNDSGSTYY